MAKLIALPEQAIIDGFRGVIDFYDYCGIPVARKWPRKIGPHRSPGVMSTWAAFTYASREWTNLSQVIKDAYNTMAGNSGLSGRDLMTRSYLGGMYRNPLEPIL